MHCPRCGHQQNSDEIRFCTKCGLAMSEVKEILVPELRKNKAKKKKNNIGKGVRQGLAMMLFGFVLITILAILRDLGIVPQVFVKIAALVFCVGGVIRMGLPFIFNENKRQPKDDSPVSDATTQNLFEKTANDKSLPEAQYYPPINFGAKNYDTGEMFQPASVTENTTKLLKDELKQT